MDMGVEDVCDTGLVLGLPYEGKNDLATDRHSYRDTKLNRRRSSPIPLETSLTLSLSDDTYASIKGKLDATKVSSFENAYRSGAKKERDIGCEEVEVGRASKVSDREEDGYSKKKLRLSREQSALLDDTFKQHATLNPKQKQALAKKLNLRPRQVEVWFQNRRARTKLKQTEVDCEFLKKCCETLTDENRRLQKELQELRAIRFAAPLFMQLPAATITMCPSCKRIAGASDDSKGSSLMVAPKPHFISPFSHSATC